MGIERDTDPNINLLLEEIIRHTVIQWEYPEDSVQPLRENIRKIFSLSIKNNKRVNALLNKLLNSIDN